MYKSPIGPIVALALHTALIPLHVFAIPPHLVLSSAPLVDVPLVGVLPNPYVVQRWFE